MKKRLFILSLCVLLLMSYIPVGATYVHFGSYKNGSGIYTPQNPRQISDSVWVEPYMDTPFTTVYAPWLKNYHFMTSDEYEAGVYAGEACQQIRQMEISPFDSNIIYFGTDTSGIYKTTNGGKNWYSVSNHISSHCTKGLLCDPIDPNTVYSSFRGSGFFRSKDGARTWEFILKDTDSYKVAMRSDTIRSDAEGNIFLAAGSGIWRLDRKTDELVNLYPEFNSLTGTKGATWYDIDVSPDGQIIYACCREDKNEDIEDGVYATFDGGKTWQIITSSEERFFHPYSLAMHPEDPMHIFVSGSYESRATGEAIIFEGSKYANSLYESFDGGKTTQYLYTHVYENLPEGVKATVKSIDGLQFSPKRADGEYALHYCAYGSTYPMRVSYDYGRTFEQVYKKSDRIDENTIRMDYDTGKTTTGYLYQAFDIDPKDPDRIIFASSGVYEKKDGKIRRITSGFSGAAIVDIAVSKSGKAFMSAMDIGAYISDGEFSPTQPSTVKEITGKYDFHYAKAVYDPNDENHLIAYIGSANGNGSFYGVRQSFDGGYTMSDMNEDTKLATSKLAENLREKYPDKPTHGNPNMLQYDDEDPNTIYMSYHNSYDNGKTWVRNEINGEKAYILDIQDDKPNRFAAVTGTGADTKLYLSEDKGKTWKYICTLGVSDFKDAVLSSGEKNELWYSRKADFAIVNLDTGTRTVFPSLLGTDYFNNLEQNPEDPNHWIIGSTAGSSNRFSDFKVAETRDGGESWHCVPGIWSSQIHAMQFIPGTTKVYLGTMGGLLIYDYAELQKFLENKVTVMQGSDEMDFSVMPVIQNNRVMVPMRDLFEKLGAKVSYNDSTGEITANKDGNYVSMYIGKFTALLNGDEITLDSTPYIDSEKGKTMIPLRFAAQSLGINVGWSAENRIVYIEN